MGAGPDVGGSSDAVDLSRGGREVGGGGVSPVAAPRWAGVLFPRVGARGAPRMLLAVSISSVVGTYELVSWLSNQGLFHRKNCYEDGPSKTCGGFQRQHAHGAVRRREGTAKKRNRSGGQGESEGGFKDADRRPEGEGGRGGRGRGEGGGRATGGG